MPSRFFRYDPKSDSVVEATEEKTRKRAKWPMASEAAGVHPTQIDEATQFSRASGVPTEYDGEGRPVFTGPGHRRKYLKAWKMFDRSGFD